MSDRGLKIFPRDLEDINLEEKGELLSFLRHHYSGRLDSIHKFQSIFIALFAIVIGFLGTLFLPKLFIIIVSVIILTILISIKYWNHRINNEKFGCWIRVVEESVRGELKKKLTRNSRETKKPLRNNELRVILIEAICVILLFYGLFFNVAILFFLEIIELIILIVFLAIIDIIVIIYVYRIMLEIKIDKEIKLNKDIVY